MARQNDGGPAFPGRYQDNSMSLRDYFAGQALVGLIAGHPKLGSSAGRMIDNDGVAGCAYGVADAMLAARKAVP